MKRQNQRGAGMPATQRVRLPAGASPDPPRLECECQREQLPDAIRELVVEDQRRRNDICWRMFDF
jgi:hypothetical protein